MRCYYEELEIETGRACSADDIKRQYRKLALQWHPDKNQSNEDVAAARFKDISNAYTILSDPRERQWYDDHREAILRGAGKSGAEDEEDEGPINLWAYFSTRFSGEFYSTFDALFRRIEAIETAEDLSRTDAPLFGNADTELKQVRGFYAHWSNFISSLSFTYADTYNTTEAPNRITRRAMEKDNKKARDQAKSEHVNTVRSLVQYVKKQDPRYAQVVREEERKRNDRASTLEAKKKSEAEKRKERNKTNAVAEDDREHERRGAFLLADNDDDDDDTDDDEVDALAEEISALRQDARDEAEGEEGKEEEVFVCAVCEGKVFESEAQLAQHQTSKVHRKRAQDAARAVKKTGSRPPR